MKRTLQYGFIISLGTGSFLFMFFFLKQVKLMNISNRISIEVLNPSANEFELFFRVPAYEYSAKQSVKGSAEFQQISFTIPGDTFSVLRLDVGTFSSKIILKSLKFHGPYSTVELPADSLVQLFQPVQQVTSYKLDSNHQLEIITLGNDPFLVSQKSFEKIFQRFANERKKLGLLPWFISGLFSLILMALLSSNWKRIPPFSVHYVWVSGFGLLLLLPVITNLFQKKLPLKDSEEKRSLALYPEFQWDGLATWSRKYDDFYNDHFGLRKELIALQNYTKWKIFHTSGNPDKVIVGKDGWMYGAMDFMKEDFQNAIPFSEEDLQTIQKNLEDRFQYFASQGIKYYLFIPPSKGTIYPEYMPSYIRKKSETSRLDQILTYLTDHPFIKIIDCRTELLAQKEKEQVYYKKDTHWNYIGAFVGYKKLMEEVKKDFPAIPAVDWDDYERVDYINREMNLPAMLSLSQYLVEKEDYLMPKFTPKARQLPPPGYSTSYIIESRFYETADTSLLRVVVHHDSYTLSYIPWLNESFERTVYLWSHIMFPHVYKEEKPDMVIHEMAETTIRYLITENPIEMKPPTP